jgi:acyl-CoA synthetase (NDP forming)
MPDTRLRHAFFSPQSIALIGASADEKKLTARPQRFLQRFGYTGKIFPINPGRREVLGLTAYPDLASAPGPIDHAMIMVPAAHVPDAVERCCEAKIPVATIFSAGFAELGEEGLAIQQRMVKTARAGGLRLLGPNCMGMINVGDAIPLTVNAVIELEPLIRGPLGVVSQSGSMLGSLLSRAQARGLGFSKLVSVGNECDLGVGEIAGLMADDDATKAILLFLETFRDADELAKAARRAHAAGKPVVVYKLGRSSVGRQVATTHTGAMTGPDEVADAFFCEHGIIRISTIEALFETPQLVMGHKPPAGKRVSVVTGTGGAAAMVVDRLGEIGADVVGPSAECLSGLAAKGIHISDAPLTDIPMGQSEGGRYAAILSGLLGSDHCDAVVSVVGSSSLANPQVLVDRVLSAEHRERKPLAVFLAPRADNGLKVMQENGVAAFRTPESCADAVYAYLRWRAPGERPAGDPSVTVPAAAVTATLAGRRVNEAEAGCLFSAIGIPVVEQRIVKSVDEKVDIAGPCAIKILSADIPHKTDAGLVALNVGTAQIASTVARLFVEAQDRFPAAAIDGVLVQRMERGLAEVIVGYRRDPEVGPVVMLGMGGITAELQKGRAVRIAPVTLETAKAMIEEVPGLAVIRGFRNLPLGDRDALARAIRAISQLACLEGATVEEAEINPLIVKAEGEGVTAVDGLVALS